jgi:hypothetical protein
MEMRFYKSDDNQIVPIFSSEYFSSKLNSLYDNFCSIIKYHEGDINISLIVLLSFIAAYWDYAEEFPVEDLHMILNVMKLVRSIGWSEFSFLYDSKNFHKLDEKYIKLTKTKKISDI